MTSIEQRARKLYGISCTQVYCQAGHGERSIVHVDPSSALRVDEGYIVTIQVYVPDEESP